jgi:hypothetical protein
MMTGRHSTAIRLRLQDANPLAEARATLALAAPPIASYTERLIMLVRGDRVPHFVVTALDGATVRYAALWQRQNLLLLSIPDESSPAVDRYLAGLQAHIAELTAYDTACIVTREAVAGVPHPGVVIADRWGEIYEVAGGPIDQLPGTGALVEWLRWVQAKCPECEGEAR